VNSAFCSRCVAMLLLLLLLLLLSVAWVMQL
jgi:hypothetical protein